MATPISATAAAAPPPPKYQPTVSVASPHDASARAVHRSFPTQPTVQTPPPSRFKSLFAKTHAKVEKSSGAKKIYCCCCWLAAARPRGLAFAACLAFAAWRSLRLCVRCVSGACLACVSGWQPKKLVIFVQETSSGAKKKYTAAAAAGWRILLLLAGVCCVPGVRCLAFAAFVRALRVWRVSGVRVWLAAQEDYHFRSSLKQNWSFRPKQQTNVGRRPQGVRRGRRAQRR